jgi:uncharacterized membrane protein YkvA (DUF1232 family)
MTTEIRPEVPSVFWSRCGAAITATFRDLKCLCLILKHPGTPWYVRIVLFCPVAYLCSPIQLLPTFIPVVGQLVRGLVSDMVLRDCQERAGTTKLASLSVARTDTEVPSKHQANLIPPTGQPTVRETIHP